MDNIPMRTRLIILLSIFTALLTSNVNALERPVIDTRKLSSDKQCARKQVQKTSEQIQQIDQMIAQQQQRLDTFQGCPSPDEQVLIGYMQWVASVKGSIKELNVLKKQGVQILTACKSGNIPSSRRGQVTIIDQFNTDYTELQQKTMSDNRQYTLLSNIMKTKKDTACSAIHNTR